MLVMTLIAGGAAVRRCSGYRGVWLDSVISMWASSWLVAAVALFGVIQVQRHDHSWYHPQYCIPLMGMILGNTLNGIALGWTALATNWRPNATRSKPCWPWAPRAGRPPGGRSKTPCARA